MSPYLLESSVENSFEVAVFITCLLDEDDEPVFELEHAASTTAAVMVTIPSKNLFLVFTISFPFTYILLVRMKEEKINNTLSR